ncbi:discoidin domain-containing protein [Anaerobaca lacustris]|uniref:Discoidin domain-containing protein n=1 Tax=Anaerobaca lacustris TaxID=3044600 RepID=A0AAW6U418_9BACT|nr:discoidin domain-containing protein [Sedimentisphaerales bacterium M17dextr]
MGIVAAALAACLFVCAGSVRGGFTFGEPTKVPNINSDFSDHSPQISRDGLELYFVSTRSSSLIGAPKPRIWVSRRPTKKDPWSAPVELNMPKSFASTHTPSLAADGLELYFSDGTINIPNAGGYGASDIWVMKRSSRGASWSEPVNLGPTINTQYREDTPCISADGLELYFSYNSTFSHVVGHVCSEIVVATRPTRDAPWGEPVNLGPNINTFQYEYTPFISYDGLLLFFSRGRGKSHIYVSRRATIRDPWGPADFFAPVNSGGGIAYADPGESEYSLSFASGDPTLYFSRGSDVFAMDYNIWQVEVIPIVDFNGDGVVDGLDLAILMRNRGVVGTRSGPVSGLCDIAPLPFGDGVVDDKDLAVFYEYADSDLVMVPSPAFGEEGVAVFVGLHWTSGTSDGTCDVYFGTSHADVEGASRDNPMGVLVSENQTGNRFALEGPLDFERTYYWRVDEVDLLSDSGIVKGLVWNFTTEATVGPIRKVVATASSAEEGAGPENTVNGSGLDADDQHSVAAEDMWLSAAEGPQPSWIQYEFDTVYPLDAMWVWNYNGQFEPVLGMGCKDVTVEYSEDGTAWTTQGDFEFARATAQSDYAHNTVIQFGGTTARYVRLTALSNWGGISPQYGLSEVRFFYTPPAAIETDASDN